MAHAIVSASHVDGRWRLDNAQVKLGHDKYFGWHADAANFGCGHSCPTPEAAIRDLLLANGCTKVVIHSVHLDQEG